jgi:hypothetical protein
MFDQDVGSRYSIFTAYIPSMAILGTDLLEVPIPYIYKAYFLGLCKEIYPQNMALSGTVPPI